MAEYNHMATQGSTIYLAWGDNRNILFTPNFPDGRPDPDVFFEIESVPSAQILVLTPTTDTNLIDTDHTVIATVSDSPGNPLAGQTVEFRVNGVHVTSGSDTTDIAGEATFTYTGTTEGDDTITAWVDQDGDGIQDPNEPFDVATKKWKKSTAIILVKFTAIGQEERVLLEWETASEPDTEGFNLWRSEAADGEYTRLNTGLIQAQGSGDTGASYEYVDTEVVKDVTYYYKLEDVDTSGVSTFYGPVRATPS
jgi:hypothetical protein